MAFFNIPGNITGPIELGQSINSFSGDVFGIGILIFFWMLLFTSARQNSLTQPAFTSASFATFLMATALYGMTWISSISIPLALLGMTIGGAFLSRGGNF